jgi:hypothetical protein
MVSSLKEPHLQIPIERQRQPSPPKKDSSPTSKEQLLAAKRIQFSIITASKTSMGKAGSRISIPSSKTPKNRVKISASFRNNSNYQLSISD